MKEGESEWWVQRWIITASQTKICNNVRQWNRNWKIADDRIRTMLKKEKKKRRLERTAFNAEAYSYLYEIKQMESVNKLTFSELVSVKRSITDWTIHHGVVSFGNPRIWKKNE